MGIAVDVLLIVGLLGGALLLAAWRRRKATHTGPPPYGATAVQPGAVQRASDT